MFIPSHLKTLHPLQVFSVKPSLSPMKVKNLIYTLIVSLMRGIIRELSKVKASMVELLRENQSNIHFPYPSHKKRLSKSKRIILGSFRLHYNWCSSKSSHVLPLPSRVYGGLPAASASHLYHDSNGNTVIPAEQQVGEDFHDSQLAGYLQWLEEKIHDDKDTAMYEQEINEIDMLAEMFIANSHEKFRLEKQESDRRFQEMLARGM